MKRKIVGEELKIKSNADKLESDDWKEENGILTPPESKKPDVVKAEFKLKIKGFTCEKRE